MARWLLIFFVLLALQGCQSFIDDYHKNQSSSDPDVQKALDQSSQEMLRGGEAYRLLPDGCRQYLTDGRVAC